MNFSEISMCKQVLEEQLPKLINALDKISESMIQKKVSDIPMSLPENYLEDIFYGNLEIGTFSKEGYKKETNKKIVKVQDQLKAQLTEAQWNLFKEYSNLINESESEECFRMFQHGYRTAMHLILAGIQPISGEPKEK